MEGYNLLDLEKWEEKALTLAEEFGLKCFQQEFEVCDYEDMLSLLPYTGMPSHYPHWSYGKSYERQKTLYRYGLVGLPYEMVINSNPAVAYLMRENSLLLQALTMAHVFGHNDFFKNNSIFKHTRPELVVERFKTHADRVRKYIEDPSIGLEKVEAVLDAAHALSLQCHRNLDIPKLSEKEQMEAIKGEFFGKEDDEERMGLKKRKEFREEDFKKAMAKRPLKPDEDILLFIRDHNHESAEWEKDILTIVHEEAQYFIPQIETKIMNEGWASFWHKKIVEVLRERFPEEFTQGMFMEFMVRHNQVIAPVPGGLNPYHLGINIWADIEHRYDEALAGKICEDHASEYEKNGRASDLGKKTGRDKVFEVREAFRDSSFIQNFLNETLMRKLDFFEHLKVRDGSSTYHVVTHVADTEGWKVIRNTLARSVGMGNIPVIKVTDSNYDDDRILLLEHDYDGRDLRLVEYAERTIAHVQKLWRRKVFLRTRVHQREGIVRSIECFFDNDKKFKYRPL